MCVRMVSDIKKTREKVGGKAERKVYRSVVFFFSFVFWFATLFAVLWVIHT